MTSSRRADLAGLLLVLLVAVALEAWMWGKLGDPVYDFGRDPYMGFHLLNGKALYRDVAYLYGPISPFLTMVWFKLLGVSIRTVLIANSIVLVAIILMQFKLLRELWGVRGAVAGSLVFVILFGLGNSTGMSNFNFLTPYTGSVTYGYAFSIAMLAFLGAAFRSGKSRWLFAAGAMGAASALCKIEFVATSLIVLCAAAIIIPFVHRLSVRHAVVAAVLMLLGFVTAVVLILAAMSLHTPLRSLLAGIGQSVSVAFDPRMQNMKAFREGAGVEHVTRNLSKLVVYFSFYLRVIAPAALIGLAMKRRGVHRPILATLFAVGVFLWIVLATFDDKFWVDFGRGVPVVIALGLIGSFIALFRSAKPVESASRATATMRMLFILFSLSLLLRMPLNYRIYNYGFVQAAPGAIVFTILLVEVLPKLIDTAGGYGQMLRLASIGMIAAVVFLRLQLTAEVLQSHDTLLGSGPDAMWVRPDGAIVRDAIAALQQRARPSDTVAAWPELPLANFLARRTNLLRYELLDPIGVVLAGNEQTALNELQSHPPDWILLAEENKKQYNAAYFGVNYAVSIMRWIDANYTSDTLIGKEVGAGKGFGIRIYRRKISTR
jgi:hypothetical protein